jgi:WD40 repeat protein
MHWRTVISRRSFIQGAAALFTLPTVLPSKWQKVVGPSSDLVSNSVLKLVKEISYSYLLDVSPDGTKFCIYSTKNPYDSFQWSGTWKQLNSPVPANADALRVLEIGSWKEIASVALRQRALNATFFTDGEAVYVDSAPTKFIQRVLIDLKTGVQQELVSPWVLDGTNFLYFALTDKMLLCEENNSKLNRTDALLKVQLPDYKEVKRVPFAETRSASTGMTESSISISGDRKVLVYTVDNSVVYRHIDDLTLVWKQEIDKLLLMRTAVAFDGQLVAVCAGLGRPTWEKNPHIAVFDGKDGTPVAHFPIASQVDCIALSPDHKLLAVGQNLPSPKKGQHGQATVILFEIGSGKEVTRVMHDELSHPNPDHSIRPNGLRFTPDGKHLISSGLHTKVWEFA